MTEVSGSGVDLSRAYSPNLGYPTSLTLCLPPSGSSGSSGSRSGTHAHPFILVAMTSSRASRISNFEILKKKKKKKKA